ncbi:L,D-transpeptidase family protein [Sphingobium sufflavum]|uniref:L,D-transpeptidase family protein n=1 Tax=Sphingobium sufflavum TaxID=1129547 RepID=UPI001F029CB3|nr:L,D-transpeptidase family protein [Sphingobium sufflavum]MCE7795528.1 L,D-transpeptidase family protein [Sphingobium sufflavum]
MADGVIRVDTAAGTVTLDGLTLPCTIGKGGVKAAADKREGDGATPLGTWPIRTVLLRPDRVVSALAPAVPWRWIRPGDGWSDDGADPAYNRPVSLPHGPSHERLWRDDQAYDVIIVLGHNDAPPVPGLGSAIFFHQWVPGADGQPKPTEGCIAVSPESMRAVLPLLRVGMVVEII